MQSYRPKCKVGDLQEKTQRNSPRAFLLWFLPPTWGMGIFSFLSQSMDLKISQKSQAKILKCYTELQVIFRENTSKTNTDPSLGFVSHYPWAPRLHNTQWPQGTYWAQSLPLRVTTSQPRRMHWYNIKGVYLPPCSYFLYKVLKLRFCKTNTRLCRKEEGRNAV